MGLKLILLLITLYFVCIINCGSKNENSDSSLPVQPYKQRALRSVNLSGIETDYIIYSTLNKILKESSTGSHIYSALYDACLMAFMDTSSDTAFFHGARQIGRFSLRDYSMFSAYFDIKCPKDDIHMWKMTGRQFTFGGKYNCLICPKSGGECFIDACKGEINQQFKIVISEEHFADTNGTRHSPDNNFVLSQRIYFSIRSVAHNGQCIEVIPTSTKIQLGIYIPFYGELSLKEYPIHYLVSLRSCRVGEKAQTLYLHNPIVKI